MRFDSAFQSIGRRLAPLAVLVIVATVAGIASVAAADLYYEKSGSSAGTPYDDPRYAEIYGESERYRGRDVYVDKYADRYSDSYDRSPLYGRPYEDYRHLEQRRLGVEKDYRGSYGDDALGRGQYLRSFKDGPAESFIDPPVYADKRYGHAKSYHACLRPRQMRRLLRRTGWHRLGAFDRQNGVICLKASSRDDGRRYLLELDRCTGELLSAKPVNARYTYR